MDTMDRNNEKQSNISLGEAIERVLIESGLSISSFSRKVGYSRQYIYELLKTNDGALARKIQLDTLKRVCDATDYPLVRLLTEIGYIDRPKNAEEPNTVIVVGKRGDRAIYPLEEREAGLIADLAKSLQKKDSLPEA